jgi:hypothetical protein
MSETDPWGRARSPQRYKPQTSHHNIVLTLDIRCAHSARETGRKA